MAIPIYLFTGFLESGKTTFLQETLVDPDFCTGEKTLLLTALHKRAADALLARLRRGLKLGSAHSGIACTIALTGGSGRLVSLAQEMGSAQETGRKVMMEYGVSLVIAIVNQGFSEEVMAAARPAGATGGTVISGRRAGGEETLQIWGFGVQQEREAVLILCRTEEKAAIMEAVRAAYEQSSRRITTGLLNDILADATAALQPPVSGGRRLKIYYATQQSTCPPTFVFFVNDEKLMHFAYQRYLENQFRKSFGFEGTPIRFILRQKNPKEE